MVLKVTERSGQQSRIVVGAGVLLTLEGGRGIGGQPRMAKAVTLVPKAPGKSTRRGRL